MEDYQEEKAEALAWLEKYGTPTRVDSVDLSSVNPNQVWTEWWRSDQFIINEYVPNEDGTKEVMGYFITPKPWTSESGTEVLVIAIWEDCSDCDASGETEDGDYCPSCEGQGNTTIDLL